MRESMMLTLRATMLGVLLVAVPVVAHAQETGPGAPGADVGVEVEITPTDEPTEPSTGPTDPTGPTTDPTAEPSGATVTPTPDTTTPAADGELGQTGFAGLPVLLGAAGLVVVGGGVLLARRRRTA